MMIKNLFLIFASVVVLMSCSERKKVDIDYSGSKVKIEIKRLDQDIFSTDPSEIQAKVPELIEKYGEFLELYSIKIIHAGSPYQKDYPEMLTRFITDYTMNQVSEKTKEVFPDLKNLSETLSDAFSRYHYYFPEKRIPEIIAYMGGFNQSIVVTDTLLGIGLDKYLGSDCNFYDRLGIEKYLQQSMNPGNIAPDAMRAWALTEFVYKDSVDNLVNNMIYQGKIQYFVDAVLPDVSDSLKFGFKADQLQWCIQNEKQMWNYLIDEKLLFTTDYMTINKHINPAPFTSGYPHESPGRASVWLGWKIVKAYMDRNTDVTLKELMNDDDYQTILSESRYEP